MSGKVPQRVREAGLKSTAHIPPYDRLGYAKPHDSSQLTTSQYASDAFQAQTSQNQATQPPPQSAHKPNAHYGQKQNENEIEEEGTPSLSEDDESQSEEEEEPLGVRVARRFNEMMQARAPYNHAWDSQTQKYVLLPLYQ